jgi:nucleotide-binding universal stress UspA family protein
MPIGPDGPRDRWVSLTKTRGDVMKERPSGPVIVAYNGSKASRAAAVYAAREASRRRVKLTMIYAHQPTPMWGPATPILDDYRWEQDWVHRILTDGRNEVTSAFPELEFDTKIMSGSAAGALIDASATASLVVTGTHSTAGIVGHLAGSVAAQIAAHADAPVIVVRDTDGSRPDSAAAAGRIVVGLDGSDESQRALAFAVDEAVDRVASIEAVYGWCIPDVHDIEPFINRTYILAEEKAKADRLVTEAVSGWSDRYPDLAITHRVVYTSDPVDALLQAAADADLIVVGSRGHGGFLGLRLGSTVDALIRVASVPVAVVRGEYAGRR